MKEPKLEPKTVKSRIRILKASLYKGCMVYLRFIDTDIFEWLLVFNNQIYSSYLILSPRRGKSKLSEAEIMAGVKVVWAGATATIDTLKGEGLDKIENEANRALKEKSMLVAGIRPGIN